MQDARARVIQNDVPTLGDFRKPSIVFRIDPIQWQVLQPNQRSVVRVVDLGDSSEMFHDLPRQVEDAVELLLLRMPLTLSRSKRSRPVQQEEQFTSRFPGLAHDTSHGDLARIGDCLIGMASRRKSVLPGVSRYDGALLVGNRKDVLFAYELLEFLDGLQLFRIRRPNRLLAQQGSQRSRHPSVCWSCMLSPVVGRTQKAL